VPCENLSGNVTEILCFSWIVLGGILDMRKVAWD
jgi:hypothetical protein